MDRNSALFCLVLKVPIHWSRYGARTTPAQASADSSGLWSWSAGVSDKPSLEVSLKHVPECDPDFVPAVMWNRAYRKLAAETAGSAPLAIGLSRPGSHRAPCVPDWEPATTTSDVAV